MSEVEVADYFLEKMKNKSQITHGETHPHINSHLKL